MFQQPLDCITTDTQRTNKETSFFGTCTNIVGIVSFSNISSLSAPFAPYVEESKEAKKDQIL
jgi:hypothetical protein